MIASSRHSAPKAGSGVPRGVCVALFLTLVLGAALRIWRLDNSQIGGDECFSWRMAQHSVGEIFQRTGLDVHPPLSYIFLKAWMYAVGDSPFAFRSFVAFCGLLGIPLIYLTFWETVRDSDICRHWSHYAALFVTFIFAVQQPEVIASRFGRMYSLGVVLSLLTAWLLLRALRAKQRVLGWWTAYGLTVAGFCYTHYFAFFSVAAQCLFVLGLFVANWKSTTFRDAVSILGGFIFAGLIALFLFVPWLPVFSGQFQAVQREYWIPGIRISEVAEAFAAWSTGIEQPGAGIEATFWMGAFAFISAASLIWGDRAARFCLLQAIGPWILAVAVSLISGRSIFVARYLIFAHPFLLMYFGWLWLKIPTWTGRVVFTGLICILALVGIAKSLMSWNSERPVIEMASEYVEKHRQPGDVFLADGAVGVNCWRCYLANSGARDTDVRTRWSPFGQNVHFSHAASLATSDYLDEDNLGSYRMKRVWVTVDRRRPFFAPLSEFSKMIDEVTFTERNGEAITLRLFGEG